MRTDLTNNGTRRDLAAAHDLLDPSRLERRSRRLLAAGYLFAAVMLAIPSLTLHAPPRVALAPEKPERIIHADIIELPAKPADEPFRMSPPQSAHRMTRMERLPATPFLPEGRLKSPGMAMGPGFESRIELPSGLGSTPSLPGVPDSTRYDYGGSGIADTGVGGRIPEGGIDLTGELIDIGALDDGRYKAMIIRDPEDARNIKGYVHIPAAVWGTFMRPAAVTRKSVPGLAEAAYRYTGLILKIDPPVFLNSPELRKYPFIYITADSIFDITPDEARGFRKYLDEGGFALMEPYGIPDPVCIWPRAAPSMIQMIKSTFDNKFRRIPREPEFKDLTREIQEKLGEPVKMWLIPNTHEFYKSFFDLNISQGEHAVLDGVKCPNQPGNYLEGIWRQRRLALVYSEKAFGRAWSEFGDLRTGVNMLVFALSQPGGNTRQLVDNSTVASQQKRTWWDYKSRMQYLDEERSTLNPKYRTKTPKPE